MKCEIFEKRLPKTALALPHLNLTKAASPAAHHPPTAHHHHIHPPMSRRSVATFPLSQQHIQSLIEAGYTVASDVRNIQPARLAQDLKCTLEIALKILKTCKPSSNEIRSSSSSARSGGTSGTTTSSGTSSTSATSSNSGGAGSSALALLQKAKERKGIITFSPEIDKQLFTGTGGVPIGRMTEFCGAPGLGKTQLCIQLACNVSIPTSMGGVEGACVYIDTEVNFFLSSVSFLLFLFFFSHVHVCAHFVQTYLLNVCCSIFFSFMFLPLFLFLFLFLFFLLPSSSLPLFPLPLFLSSVFLLPLFLSSFFLLQGSFMVDRVHQIATALVTHLRRNIRKAAVIPTVDTILSNIHVFRVHDHTEQSAVLHILPTFLAQHSNIRLVILDSVAFHFRHDFHDMAKRSRYAFLNNSSVVFLVSTINTCSIVI